MEMLDPEQRVCNEEISHFCLAIVKDLRPPVRMFALSWIRILKSRRSVKIRQSMRVSGEMCGYPVKNNPNIVPMQMID